MTRTAVQITAGVRKAERFPVSRKRKPGLPAHRPVGENRLTRNERAYYDACLEAWESISEETVREQFLFPTQRQSGDEIRSDLAAIQPFLGDITLYQLEQSGAFIFNEVKTAVAADWAALEKAVTDTPSEFAASMRFNRASPQAVAYAELSAANMVTDMVDSQVTAVRSIIAKGYREGLGRGKVQSQLVTLLNEMPSPRKVPAGVAGMATIFGDATRGLTDRYATAVFNRADKIMRDNPKIKPRQLKRKVNAYGNKLKRSRARTIARTEMMRAANQGRLQGMWQAADRGLVSPTMAKKQWVTSRFDVCSICVPLSGQAIGIRESFGPMGQAPPAHPNCRCTIRMLPDPLTFGIPMSSGTGQTDAPLRFVRPQRPGLKIEDLSTAPGVVAEPGALIGQPGSRASLADDVPAPLQPEEIIGRPSATDAQSRMVRRYDEDLDGPGEEVDLLEMFTGDNARDDRLAALLDKDNWARDMNDVLYDDVFDAGSQISQLEATLQQVKYLSYNDEALTVYRAGSISAENVGAHSRFASTSRNRSVAQHFSDTRGYGDVVEYQLQPGDIAADLEKLGGRAAMFDEAEIMVDGATLLRRIIDGADDVATGVTRQGNASEQILLYGKKNKRAKEVFDPVIQQMDDAGFVLPALEDGATEVQLIGTTKANGKFKPMSQTQEPKLRKPQMEEPGSWDKNPDGSYKYGTTDEQGRFTMTDADRDKYYGDVDEWNIEARQLEDEFNDRYQEWLNTGGVWKSRITVSRKTFYKSPSGGRVVTPQSAGSQRNTMVHEIGHRADFSDELIGYRTEKLIERVKQEVDLPPSGNIFDVDALDLPEADRDLWRFMQAAVDSDSLARARQTLARATGEDFSAYIDYISEPVELWARAFNQWFTTSYGDADMLADMAESAAGWGYQWRQAEFDEELAPLVEKVLRSWGVIE